MNHLRPLDVGFCWSFKGSWITFGMRLLTEIDVVHEFSHGWHACCHLSDVEIEISW